MPYCPSSRNLNGLNGTPVDSLGLSLIIDVRLFSNHLARVNNE